MTDKLLGIKLIEVGLSCHNWLCHYKNGNQLDLRIIICFVILVILS
jgi:hypothetical protein